MATFSPRHLLRFIKTEQFSGILLLVSVLLSLVIANTFLSAYILPLLTYSTVIVTPLCSIVFHVPTWVNDGLMSVFFLLVGLEIKREFVEGELSSFKKASLPVFAAMGGMLMPALIYSLCNVGKASLVGWAIPTATDIAFALAVLALLGNRVPSSLKVFLIALAIVDDLGAIVMIALFYSVELHYDYLLWAALVVGLLMLLNRFGIQCVVWYVLLGLLLWYLLLHSGVHATLSGVILAFTIPTNAGRDTSPLERLEQYLQLPVGYVIMPLFAFVNTCIFLDISVFEHWTPISLGILLGLVLGKPLGIVLFSFFAVRAKIGVLPKGCYWKQIVGLGMLGGIGFTMSIFVSMLSFADVGLQVQAKTFVLLASLCSGFMGYFYLNRLSKRL